MGGRGQSANGNKHFKFSNAGDGGLPGGPSKNLFPARANVRIKTKTPEAAMEEFRERYKNADHEWAYAIDDQGYVHEYREGGKHSVSVNGGKGMMVLHNHPGGGAFSKADLLVTANSDNKGIVASGKHYDYVFTKGTHFKADEFRRAVNNATLTGKDYSEGVHNWLTKNQRKYGFKYYRRKND